MQDKNSHKYDVLRILAVAAARGENLAGVAQEALVAVSTFVGLSAAALYIWDENFRTTVAVTHANSDISKERIAALEQELFAKLRRDKHLLSAYMSFGGPVPTHSFSLPLLHNDKPFGAVVGLQEGGKKPVAEDEFLEALASILAISYAAQGIDHISEVDKDLLDKERLAAIIETAVTVNHEVNNPLTAILGNVQLLLLKRNDLDDELKEKLEIIEASAMKIKDVTQRLMRLTTPRSVEYSNGTRMVDISEDEEQKKQE